MDQTHRKHRLASAIGALIALGFFVWKALSVAIYFGGYAGRLLAEGIVGGPAEGPIGTGLVLFGQGVGVAAVASLFAVIGGAIGAGVGVIYWRVKERQPQSAA